MEITLENRAHVIVCYDPNFISGLPNIHPKTEKVYYESFSLRTPEWLSAEDVAGQLSEANDSGIIERLELAPVHLFTSDANKAMTFPHHEVYNEASGLEQELGIRLAVEVLNQLYYPF